ncbi:hypothetical protein [Priestia megaterium]|uniref:hypothetical protein n=1 Tax=Priestia megaterium TaxID=1404 RepID=UPI002E1A1AD7|nr:hypothetical protein [Priestia megaterium]
MNGNFGKLDDSVGKLSKVIVSIDQFPRLTGETEDGPRIQRAIDSLNGGSVRFPYPAQYNIRTKVTVKPYVTLIGADTILLTDVSKAPVFNIYVGKNDANGAAAFTMKASSGMKGFTFNYPEQALKTATAPVPFSWTIDTTKAVGDGNTDNVYLENLMLLNSYQGINLQDAGRFNISNIYGNPIYKGIRVNNVKDVARGKHIHFWTFRFVPGDNMYTWIRANGIAFELLYVDQLSAFDWFAFGYKTAFNLGSGFWGDLVSCCADVCVNPIYLDNGVNMARITGGTYTSTDINSSYVKTNTSVDGRVMITSASLYGGCSIGAIISSNTGEINFTDCDFKDGTTGLNGWKYSPIAVEGDCRVRINGGSGINRRFIIGGDNVSINGLKRMPRDVEISPANFNMATWASGTPTGWTVSANATGSITQITNGISLAVTPNPDQSNVLRTIDFTVPTSYKNEKDFYVLEFEYEPKVSSGQFRFYSRFLRSDGNRQACSYGTDHAFFPNKKIKVRMPFYLGRFTDTAIIRLEWQSYGTVSGTLEITNLKWYKANITSLSNHQIDTICQDIFLDPYAFGVATKRIGNNKEVNGPNIPSAGSFTAGDIIVVPITDASEQGTAGSKYVIEGYRRLTTGSTNVSGTDWLPRRTLTGN